MTRRSLAEYLSHAPLDKSDVEKFLKSTDENRVFIDCFIKSNDMNLVEWASEEERENIFSVVSNHIRSFIQENDLPLDGWQQLLRAAEKKYL